MFKWFSNATYTACSQLLRGQAEDYGIIINDPQAKSADNSENSDELASVKDISIVLYPNPSIGEAINILLQGTGYKNGPVMVKITDILGKEVYSNQVVQASGLIEMKLNEKRKLASGMYVVNVIVNEQHYSHRLVIVDGE